MPAITHSGHGGNLVGVPAAWIADYRFNQQPAPLTIAGTRETAASLFENLERRSDLAACGVYFQDYMSLVFGFESEQRLGIDRTGRRRYRNSYLKLIQDWGLDANNAQGALLKGWVESRFGLFPTFHKQAIAGFMTPAWLRYVEEKMNNRYHNNCIYLQLDLLYEFCQWAIQRFARPARHHKILYRGVNDFNELRVTPPFGQEYLVVRFNSLVSFTDQAEIAGEFGDRILKVRVPMIKLLFFPELLPDHGLRGENEYLVIGGDYRVDLLR